jgi:anti-anti-sigma factor
MDAAVCAVTVTANHHSAHVVLAGEFDTAEAEELAHEVGSLVANPPDIVLVNLRRVEFMGSTTLRVLINLHDACIETGGEFVITDRSRCVDRLIDIAGLSAYLGLGGLTNADAT